MAVICTVAAGGHCHSARVLCRHSCMQLFTNVHAAPAGLREGLPHRCRCSRLRHPRPGNGPLQLPCNHTTSIVMPSSSGHSKFLATAVSAARLCSSGKRGNDSAEHRCSAKPFSPKPLTTQVMHPLVVPALPKLGHMGNKCFLTIAAHLEGYSNLVMLQQHQHGGLYNYLQGVASACQAVA